MTIEELVKIIVEVVKKYIFLDSQKVLALYFDETNREELIEAARNINGRADCFSIRDIERVTGSYDAMFVDYLPLSEAAEAALGLGFSPFGRLMGALFAGKKPVFQLKKAPGSAELNPACRQLLKEHWARLAALGVVLLAARPSGGKGQGSVKAVYEKNVLSKKDLYPYADAGKVIVGKGVLVTALAEEAAKAMNIEIVKPE